MGIHPRWVWLSALAAAVSGSGAVASAAENNAVRAALNTITSAELGHHVDVLAADAYEGREAGSRGGRAAGEYIRASARGKSHSAGRRRRRLFSVVWHTAIAIFWGSSPDATRN